MDKITYTAIQNVDQSLLLDGSVDWQTVAMGSLATIMSDANVEITINEWPGGE